jgi:hypothetical protein
MPAEEERGGRYITMAEESCGSIGSTGSREAGWIAEGDGERAEELRCAPGEEGKGRALDLGDVCGANCTNF